MAPIHLHASSIPEDKLDVSIIELDEGNQIGLARFDIKCLICRLSKVRSGLSVYAYVGIEGLMPFGRKQTQKAAHWTELFKSDCIGPGFATPRQSYSSRTDT